MFDGHGGWATAEDLRIPADVRRCVHMVAAHEVRGSFPVDLVDGANCEQIIYPGVHSDVGGGYTPGNRRSVRGLPETAPALQRVPAGDGAVPAGQHPRRQGQPHRGADVCPLSPVPAVASAASG
ncbi:hypothetical protein G6F57_019154 [Rhizopus arrhizus]|nr:hypothetical protein G6F40_014079 [Rhizopus arrhizus]KAG1440094.1 hypothetical protein G6F57_019154 [Rhizopus arrhizus]